MSQESVSSSANEGILQVLEVARQLSEPCELPVLLTHVIDAGRRVLKADRGSVFLYDQQTNELYMITGTGLEALRFSAKQGLAGECATKREILNIPDCYADARFNQEIDRKTGYRTQCMISVPLVGMNNELVGVMQLLNSERGRFDEDDERLALALGAQAGVAIQRQQLLEEQQVKLKLERDLKLARDIQQGVLPAELPEVTGYDIACYNRPADETGGDIYDVMLVGGDNDASYDGTGPVVLLLADATGHGIGPALSVTQVRAMFRIGQRLSADLRDLVQHVDQQLYDDLDGSRFVTAFIGMLDPKSNLLHYEARGQGPLLFYHREDDSHDYKQASSLPMGIMPDLPADPVPPVELKPGDIAVLITDGFYECMDPDGEQFGEDRVVELVRKHRDEPAQAIIQILLDALDDFAYRHGVEQADDLTAIIVKRDLS